MGKSTITLLCCLLVFPLPGWPANESVRAFKVTAPPVIDGILDEAVWKNAPSYSDFKTFIPDFGKVVPQQTRAWLAYDAENLYFAFDCQDPEPDKIKANVSARDAIIQDDWICLNIDSRFDQQGINAFYVNPLGIQMDTRFDAGKEDASIDLVWYSAGTRDDHGYFIEVKIPLKSLRFSAKDPVSMGLLLERFVSRTATHVGYPALDPTMGYNFL
ncbi:MAG: carbohydrate binding family 9 domain-containing protein, partial [Bacteroidia bacterium]|nr:carbohydrate binding family 9 domain-containing protein [Bacteroidia bacterium]